MKQGNKILYFVTEDWFFCSHFLDRAIAAQKAGFQVSVLTRVNKHAQVILDYGFKLIPLAIQRSNLSVFREISLIYQLISLYRQEYPHIVHHVALKPILYGSFAAKIAGVPAIVNAPVGMGYVFSSKQLKARILKPLVILAYRFLLNPSNGLTVFENPDDREFFSKLGIVSLSRTRLIRGAGVDMQKFAATDETDEIPIIILAARMLWDKGIGEFVEAARLLRKQSIKARFVLVGAPDMDNPEAIEESQLEAWQNEGVIEWWGQQNDMPSIFRQSHIICLPSYAEGLPRVLIEAAASARPIVTTDVPGCREIVKNGENGFLILPRSAEALAQSLYVLILDPELRKQMGKKGREMAVLGFSKEQVNDETISLYKALNEQSVFQ